MIKPHGGKLINRVLKKKAAARFLKDKSLPRLVLDHDTLLDLENIAVGVYSPLTGFMTKAELNGVVMKKRLPNGLAWTVPILLPLKGNPVESLTKGQRVILCNAKDVPIGVMAVRDIYTLDKDKVASHVFGTTSHRHPGVKKLLQLGQYFIGGEIWLLQKNKYRFHAFNLEPAAVRKLIKEKGWQTVAGFQTRNVPHRAHEYLQKAALTLVDGLFIHPIVGWKKPGDFNPEMVIKTYRLLTQLYYPKDRRILSGLATAMRYAGPQEAVFHAIIRKNFGCTHFVVGRDHAGVGGFYDKYAAHQVFDQFPDLEVKPLLLRGPYYCKKCASIVNDKVCPHASTDKNVAISGTAIRARLAKNQRIPELYLRKEIGDFVFKNRAKCFL